MYDQKQLSEAQVGEYVGALTDDELHASGLTRADVARKVRGPHKFNRERARQAASAREFMSRFGERKFVEPGPTALERDRQNAALLERTKVKVAARKGA